MVRIEPEAFRLLLPTLADVLVGRQPSQGLETFGEVVGREELREMFPELLVSLIVIALDRRLLDRAIHPLDLSVCPGMIDFRQPMLDAVPLADAVEQMFESPSILQAVGELDAVVREDGMNTIRHGGDQPPQEVARGVTGLVRMQLGESELRRAVDGDEEVELSLGGLHFGDVDVEEADRIGLERTMQ